MIVEFRDLKLNEEMPIYLQIIRYVKMGMVAGTFSSGDELPSRRILSAMLKVNPNTVQKAFSYLEEEKLLISYPGAKSILTVTEEQRIQIRDELIQREALNYIRSAQQMGFTKVRAEQLIRLLWEEKGGEDG